jgi:hypothetical protein
VESKEVITVCTVTESSTEGRGSKRGCFSNDEDDYEEEEEEEEYVFKYAYLAVDHNFRNIITGKNESHCVVSDLFYSFNPVLNQE